MFNKSFLKNEKTWKRVNGGMECHSAFEKVELEIALMKRLSHPNLVKLIDVVDDESGDKCEFDAVITRRLYMILEYIEKGQIMVCDQSTMTFYSPITSIRLVVDSWEESFFDEDTARRYMLDIISGLKYRRPHTLGIMSSAPSQSGSP